MKIHTLDDIYADPLAKACLHGPEADHRRMVQAALMPAEPILSYWWSKGISGLLLATDHRLLQFPAFEMRQMFSLKINYRFETWSYPYATITEVRWQPGSMFQHPVVVLDRVEEDPAIIVVSGLDPVAVAARAGALGKLIAYCQTHDIPRPALAAERDPLVIAAQLQQIYDLYRQGVLEEGDYTRARKKLLDSGQSEQG